MSFKFVLLTPKGIIFEDDVEEVLFPGVHGPTAIQGGHTPFIGSIAEPGVVKVKALSRTRYYSIFSGEIWVKHEGYTLLLTDEIEGPFEEATAKNYVKERVELKKNASKIGEEEALAALNELNKRYKISGK